MEFGDFKRVNGVDIDPTIGVRSWEAAICEGTAIPIARNEIVVFWNL
ncbi:MAG: hypothetical protein AAFX90_22350 [Pseudomonadota bacterium]